jgi:hypothetical protein
LIRWASRIDISYLVCTLYVCGTALFCNLKVALNLKQPRDREYSNCKQTCFARS